MAGELLRIRNLRISFRTPGGKVHAVRGIDLDLNRGETLAIVGESGSGKSVTARSIMGILAPNALVEGGEIIYNGIDVLKVGEDYMQQIRGEKIAMIFQDPLSSLNPIVRIGKQLTEAMIVKGKARRKKARKDFNTMLTLINKRVNESYGSSLTDEIKAVNKSLCDRFNQFEILHVKMESAYELAHDNAEYTRLKLADIIARDDKNLLNTKYYSKAYKELRQLAELTKNEFVVTDSSALDRILGELNTSDLTALSKPLHELDALLETSIASVSPNFFYLAFCRLNGNPHFDADTPEELDSQMRAYMNENFMAAFEVLIQRASMVEYTRSIKEKKNVLALLSPDSQLQRELNSAAPNRRKLNSLLGQVYKAIDASKSRFDSYKDGRVYSFKLAMVSALNKYYDNISYNKKTSKKSGGGENLIDTASLKDTAIAICDSLTKLYSKDVADAERGIITGGETERADSIIDMLKKDAQDYSRKITKQSAKLKAVKLMDEVGIPDPQKRFYQYPFEFSGGMRQRIVIAIALSADPEILICDEPTTALDVTIQGQILELINKLKEKRNISVVFITHDLGVVANMADKVSVLYAGKIVEQGTSEDVFYNPLHPYTWALLSSMPDLNTESDLEAIPGTPPNMIHPPKGDAFASRNRYALNIDFEEMPPLIQMSETHAAATWLLHPDAPKAEPPAIVTERIQRMLHTQSGNTEVRNDEQ